MTTPLIFKPSAPVAVDTPPRGDMPAAVAVPTVPTASETARTPFLSVVIPTYNEAHRLAPTLERVLAYLSAQPYTSEVLIADDGSQDATRDVAAVVAERWTALPVRILQAERNQGKGAAVRRGVLAARGARVLFSDADGSTPIEDIERLLPLLESGYDVAIGSRSQADSRVLTRQPLPRRLMGWIFHHLVMTLLLPGVRDSQCGFKAFRTPAARHIFGQVETPGFAFDVEALLLSRALGYRMKEVGVTWADAPGTTVAPLRDATRMVRDLVRLRRGIDARLDLARDHVPGAHEPGLVLVTLRQTGAVTALPLDDAARAAARASDATVLAVQPGLALLVVLALTSDEASLMARRLTTAASEALATYGQGAAVTSDIQMLPLATPLPSVREPAAATNEASLAAGHDALLTTLAIEEGRREAELRLAARRHAAWARRRHMVRLLIAANTVGLLWWLDWLLNFANAANPVLYTLLVLAECFNLLQVVGYWYTVWHERAPERRRARVDGRVDVFITTYNEPVDLVEETVRAAVAMPYPHRTYVLDDGRRPEMGAMAARNGAHWITRADNRGAKAGNVNRALAQTDGDFFVIFDADHVPQPHFLSRMMPYMDEPRVAFAQAPQYYVNRDATYIAGGAMDQQELFFGPICAGKDGLGAVFCCGTNMVVRRAAIDSVGGFREDSITEDAATSLDLHEQGWTSRYVNERLADGLAPEDLGAYVSQQRRWARGNIEMILRGRVLRRRMPLRLRLQYVWSAIYYLTAATTVFYLTLPCLYLLFGIQTVSAGSGDFIGHFLPYIFTTVFILARSAEGRLRFRAMQLSYGLFPVFLGALYSVVTGRKLGFVVTPKEGSTQSFYHLVIPQLSAVALVGLAIVVGFAHYAGAPTVTNACWAVFNVIMLSAIIRAAAPQRARRRAAADTADADTVAARARLSA